MAGGGKFEPLGLRTIFLGRQERQMYLPITRMNLFFEIKQVEPRQSKCGPMAAGIEN